MLELPLAWKRPQTIFVNSMSDLFHEDVPLEATEVLITADAGGSNAYRTRA